MLKIIAIISIGFALSGCCCSLQPYQRLYILAENIEKQEIEMASQCLRATLPRPGLEEVD